MGGVELENIKREGNSREFEIFERISTELGFTMVLCKFGV